MLESVLSVGTDKKFKIKHGKLVLEFEIEPDGSPGNDDYGS